MQTQTTFCRICESLCGLEVDVEEGRVTEIRPDSAHPATGGFACKKGLRQHALYGSPDRLTHPMRRSGERWERVEWEQAYADIAARLNAIIDAHGADAVAMYVGTAAGFSVLHPVFAQGFMGAIGSRNNYASATQDCANKFAVAEHMYGFPFIQPFPDLPRTQCLIIVGANPMVSKWSFLQVPNPRKHINQIKARGGRVIVVDPRRTETAKAAGEHLFIRPGSDVYFYLSFLHELIRQNGTDAAAIAEHGAGWETIRHMADEWPAARTEALTGITAADLTSLVATYIAAEGAALYCSTGVNMGAHGTLAFWLQEVINFVSGNLDRPGGTLVGRGIIDFAAFGKKNGLLVSDERSRVGDFRKTNDAFPGGILADEILTPGKGRIRALIVTGGNPLLTMADGAKLVRAFADLDLLVTLDILPTETATAGHYILPCTTPLERPDLPFIFPLMLGMQTQPYLQATEAILSPPGQAKDETTIYAELARACGRPLFGSRVFQGLVNLSQRVNRTARGERGVPQRFWLSLLLRLCGQRGFKHYIGHGQLRAPNSGGDFLGSRIHTASGKVELAPHDLLEAIGRLDPEGEAQVAPLRLITKREVATHNSFGHNDPQFLRNDFDRNYVYMHPNDAAQRQLTENALADVRADHASIRLPVKLTQDLLPGVIAVPHGWGHQASGQKTARASSGVNVNLLARSGVAHVDPLSGMSTLTGLPVTVQPAADANVAANWSGIP